MSDAGAINEKIFSLGLRRFNDTVGSFMDVGFWDQSVIANPNDLFWIDV